MPGFAGANRAYRPERYGPAHKRERARLAPTVEHGEAYCAQPICIKPNRWIQPGTPWCLGHNDTGTAWIGPVHYACNHQDAAKRGGIARARKYGPWPRQRQVPTQSPPCEPPKSRRPDLRAISRAAFDTQANKARPGGPDLRAIAQAAFMARAKQRGPRPTPPTW